MLLSDYGAVAVLDTGLTLVNKNQNTVHSHVSDRLVGETGIRQIIILMSA